MKTKIAVRCSSKEQKQQVIKYSGREWSPCEEHECVNLNDGCHQTEQWYSEDGYKVISFEEFEQKYLGKSPKTEFIPGKWYKAEGYNYYGKFKSIVKPRDHFHVSEGIVVATFIKDYSFEPGYTWTLVKEQEDILWLDKCSEANKFIPKEEALKPKEMEMIEGKWYKLVLNSGSINWLFKYTKGSNRTNSSKYIDLDSNIKGINNYIDSDTNIVNIEPANMEEVYKHFPEEKPKEVKSELSKWYVVPETEDNLKLIKEYFNNKFKDFMITYHDNAYSSNGIYYTHESEVPSEFVKITMDEFKKQILKQEVEIKYKSWSIKYTPEFTEDIFNHLVRWGNDRIKELEGNWYNYTKNRYIDLKSKQYFWFNCRYGLTHVLGIDNNKQHLPEISLNELISIIGYNKQEKPMEEEKWIPKVGDWVTILPKNKYSCSNFHKGANTFKIGYVSGQNSGDFVCEETEDIGNGVFLPAIRKALSHEIPSEVPDFSPEVWYNP